MTSGRSSGKESGSFRPAEARSVEAWLAGLATFDPLEADAPGGSAEPEPARVLFILDNDFGELTTVMYLVLGQKCFRGARILLSRRLYDADRDALPGRTGLWTSEQDLLEAIDSLRPRVVVFASAYLLPVHDLLGAEGIARVIEAARRHHAVVVTADPFLGLISQWSSRGLQDLISIDIPKHASEELVKVKKMGDRLLHTALSAAEEVLRPVPHLYPSYTDMNGLVAAPTDSRNLSFFNDALVAARHGPNEGDAQLDSSTAPDPNRPTAGGDLPHWMFVISLVDYDTQAMFLGAKEFADSVADLLEQAAESGRHAVLLAPAELSELVAPMIEGRERIHLLSFCSFRRAMSLLLTAEHCFYWNVVSHSILMRLWNGRPVFLFDRGHLARAVPAIYERTIAWYYQGWEPPYLDPGARLSPSALSAAAAPHARRRSEILARFRRAPAPGALLASLLEREGRSRG